MIRFASNGQNLTTLLMKAQHTLNTKGLKGYQQEELGPSKGAGVDISDNAASYQASQQYASYFPSRKGMSIDALLLAVRHPEASSSSKGKSFAEVASVARKQMDARYAAMKESGSPFDASNLADQHSLLGGLDRRSLYAVSINQGGLFSAEEIKAAQAVMKKQQLLGIGELGGIAGSAGDIGDHVRLALKFLDNVSAEEKTGPDWIRQRQALSAVQSYLNANKVATGSAPQQYMPILAELLS